MSASKKETLQSARVSLLGVKPQKGQLTALQSFILCDNSWTRCHPILSNPILLGAVLLVAAIPMLLYAAIAHGWTDALFLKVQQDTHLSSCMPDADHDRQLVYVSCPILYMHDFRGQVAGTFVENVAPSVDLTGLSMELRTEIYQWKEVEDCSNFGNAGFCRYTFEKAWVPEPISSGSFKCMQGNPHCNFPQGGIASVRNNGTIPDSLRSFKKTADTASISIGDNPGRYYLSEDLIAQLPATNKPLFFPKDGLPTVQGKSTTALGHDDSVHELRLETKPGNSEPDIGDVRAHLSMTDFYTPGTRDAERQISIVAKQAPYVYGEAHRTLVPWDSNLTSWKNGSPLSVDWLDQGAASFDEMISQRRNKSLTGVLSTIVCLHICSVTCILLGVCLVCGPLAKSWLSTRESVTPSQGTRDVLLLMVIAVALSLSYALIIVSLPWFHYREFCGGLLLASGLMSFIIAICVFSLLDSRANLLGVLREHNIISETRLAYLPASGHAEANRLTGRTGYRGKRSPNKNRLAETKDSLPAQEASPEDLAGSQPDYGAMADVEGGTSNKEIGEVEDDEY